MTATEPRPVTEGIGDVIRRHADMVYRIAFTYTKNRADTDDVFQEVFLRLCRKGNVFGGDEHIKAWLIRVTVNVCKSFLTSAWRTKTAEMTDDIPALAEEFKEVYDAVHALNPKYGIPVYLHYFEGYNVAEIAGVLSLNENTVKSRLHRARSILKKRLKGDYADV
ncbi:MAG: sigma-70 family RNA polymerase sigma factor [Clostridiales bacterium]|jgi:RNA polymerase sigma-70 factor (ECF subfamily)|nr:sigma-70 family RNA polymerase sigma factor [Clostridiales bacterium]